MNVGGGEEEEEEEGRGLLRVLGDVGSCLHGTEEARWIGPAGRRIGGIDCW